MIRKGMDIMRAKKEDFIRGAVLPRYSVTGNVPVGYRLDGEFTAGVPEGCDAFAETKKIGSDVVFSVIRWRTGDGLEFRAECTEYADFPVTEWIAYITNTSTVNSAVISDFQITAAPEMAGPVTLRHGNGDTCTPDGYSWREDEVGEDGVCIHPCGDGTSCNGAFPYMRFGSEGMFLNVAVGWTGTWLMNAKKSGGRLEISVSQKNFNTYLEPGETVRTPSLLIQAADGSADRAANLWRTFYVGHILPKENGSPLAPKLALHRFMAGGLPEFCGANEENQLEGIKAYLERGLKPDIWWIDAGWYPCGGNWYEGAGNWYPDPERFPDGLRKIGEICEQENIDLLLWFEPERAFRGSEIWREHDEYLIHGAPEDGNALFYLGDPEALRWITDRVDSIIKEYRVKFYRQDFNFSPAGYWQAGEAANRRGIHENLHIQGYYAFWDELLRRNPGLHIDSCAGGGRRNDIETMKRAVPLHYTDIGYGHHPIKQKQHRQMFEWIPYFRAHNMSWDEPDGTYGGTGRPVDEFAYQCALAPAVTSMTEWNGPENEFELGRAFIPVWRRCAEIMLRADYYPLTETNADASSWYAMQFFDPERGDGFAQIIRNVLCGESRFVLKGYVPDECLGRIYKFTEPLSGRTWTMSGSNFRNGGFEISLPERTGEIWFYCIL